MSASNKGGTIGAMIGGVAGSVIPGVGTTIGAGVGKGVGSLIGGAVDKKKSKAMLPGDENLEQRALQRQFARKKRAFETGTADQSQRSALNQTMKTGIKESLKYGAGVRGLNAMNQIYSQGLNAIGEAGKKDALDYATKEGEMINTLAQRKLELGMERYDKASAEDAQNETDAKRNLGSSLARLSGGDSESLRKLREMMLRRKKGTSNDGARPSVVRDNGKEVSMDGLQSPSSSSIISSFMNKSI